MTDQAFHWKTAIVVAVIGAAGVIGAAFIPAVMAENPSRIATLETEISRSQKEIADLKSSNTQLSEKHTSIKAERDAALNQISSMREQIEEQQKFNLASANKTKQYETVFSSFSDPSFRPIYLPRNIGVSIPKLGKGVYFRYTGISAAGSTEFYFGSVRMNLDKEIKITSEQRQNCRINQLFVEGDFSLIDLRCD